MLNLDYIKDSPKGSEHFNFSLRESLLLSCRTHFGPKRFRNGINLIILNFVKLQFFLNVNDCCRYHHPNRL